MPKILPKKKPAKKAVKKTTKPTLSKKDAEKIGDAVVKKLKGKPAKAEKPNQIMINSPVDPSVQIMVASELADDALIESELTGEVLPYYIYQFCENKPACKPEQLAAKQCPHRKTTGISVKGVNETVRRLNRDKKSGYHIRINPAHLQIERNVDQDGVKGVSVAVYAEDMITGNSAWGLKFEPYKKTGRNGSYDNTFAEEKALSKAERNAKRKLIPETVIVKYIEKLMQANPQAMQFLSPAAAVPSMATALPIQASDLESVKNLIRKAVADAKTVDVLIQLDSKTTKAEQFDEEFKAEIRSLAGKRIDELNTKGSK